MPKSIMKTILRKTLAEKRNKIENRAEKSVNICKNLINLDIYKNAKTIMIYSQIKSEVETDFLFNKLIEDKKNIVLPKCVKETSLILPIKIDNKNDLEIITYGILEPKSNILFPKNEIELVIVPAISYDLSYNRLGYGAGYYDRFLADYKGIKIGFCYFDMIYDKLPMSQYDIKVDKIITERGLV